MNILSLSIIYCLFLSHSIYASDQPPIKKSGWKFPILRAVGLVKRETPVNASTASTVVIDGIRKNLSDASLRKSIAEDAGGFEPGDLDDHQPITLSTTPNTPTNSPLDNNEIKSPLQSSAMLQAISVTNSQIFSSRPSSPEQEDFVAQENDIRRDSNSSTTDLLDTKLVVQKLQELPPFNKKPEPEKRPSQNLFLANSNFSDTETDGGMTSSDQTPHQPSRVQSTITFKKDCIHKQPRSPITPITDITSPEKQEASSSLFCTITNLCSCCISKKKNHK